MKEVCDNEKNSQAKSSTWQTVAGGAGLWGVGGGLWVNYTGLSASQRGAAVSAENEMRVFVGGQLRV